MRNRQGPELKAAEPRHPLGPKRLPQLWLDTTPVSSNRFGRIDRDAVSFREQQRTTRVITVGMRDDDRVDLLGGSRRASESLGHLTAAKPDIYQHPATMLSEPGRVSPTAAPEHRQLN